MTYPRALRVRSIYGAICLWVLAAAPFSKAVPPPRVEHRQDPQFLFQLPPGKKFKELRERWKIVDLEAREQARLRDIDAQIEVEQTKPAKDEERLEDLKDKRVEIEREYERTKMLVEADAKEFIKVIVTPASKGDSLSALVPSSKKSGYQSHWDVDKVFFDREITTKAMRKRKMAAHRYQAGVTLKESKEKIWIQLDTYLVYSRDGKERFKVLFLYRMPWERFGKESARAAQVLAKCFRM